MDFCTVINCIDGRIQLPVIKYLQEKHKIKYVDNITEAGPSLILSQNKNKQIIESMFNKISISIETHGSRLIAVTGHHDCAGNPNLKDKQINHIYDSIKLINKHFSGIKTIGLWVNDNWEVEEIKL